MTSSFKQHSQAVAQAYLNQGFTAIKYLNFDFIVYIAQNVDEQKYFTNSIYSFAWPMKRSYREKFFIFYIIMYTNICMAYKLYLENQNNLIKRV